MSPTKRDGIYYLYVAKEKGGVRLRTTQTKDAHVYRLMKQMLARLKNERRWPLLNAIIANRLTIGQVFDADRTKSLDALEASLSAEVLRPHVTKYLAACRGRGLAERNVENITRQLDAFLERATTTADLTPALVTEWLASLTTTPGTRRQYLYAVTGFTRYLVDVGVVKDYPLSRVKAPKKNPSRMTYHDEATDLKIVYAASAQFRALFAFVKATGCDLSTALNLTRQDIATGTWTVRLRGTKTANRDVHEGIIEAWARPVLTAHIGSLVGSARVFPNLSRSGAYHHHARCCEAIGVKGYTLKDSRHSVAVRMAKVGYTVFEIAEQLGTSPALVASTYARFIPTMASRVTLDVTAAAGAKK